MAVAAGAGNLDAYGRRRVSNEPAVDAIAITPSDSVNLTTACRRIWVGTTGNITLVTLSGNVVAFNSVPVGMFDVGCSRVNSTGTTASNLVAIF